MQPTNNLIYLVLAEIDEQNVDLSGFTKQEINDCMTSLVDQGFAFGKPIKRLGDPTAYYSARSLKLTSKGERRLESLLDDM